MPFKTLKELPNSVKNSLPTHAQEIYKSAFNSALDEYGPGHSENRRNKSDDPEIVAHRVAWAAVKNKYEKVEVGEWKAKS